MPIKAIEASIKSRRIRNGESEHGTRKDVVHKAILRGIKRYYEKKFEELIGSDVIPKEDYGLKIQEFIDRVVTLSFNRHIKFDQLPEKAKSNEAISKNGMINVMMTLVSHKLAKTW